MLVWPLMILAALCMAAPAQAATERARITWDPATDIDLYATDEAGNEASYQNPVAIPAATLSTDDTSGTGPEFFTDEEDPGTARTFRFKACYFVTAADVGPVTVSGVLTDGDGASQPILVVLAAPGECAELGASRGSVQPLPPDGDGDGVPDATDRCPEVAAPGTPDGCPPDTNTDGVGVGDGDGVPDADDRCPGLSAPGASDGCPPFVALPPPVTGKAVNVEPVKGVVTVRPPGGRTLRLEDAEQIPIGSVVDTRRGRVRLFSTGRDGTVQSALFYDGLFRVTQSRGARPVTDLELVERLARCARPGRASSAARRKKRRLWGDGSGAFRTSGRRSAATVSGTKWLVEDSCRGTLTRVARGKVAVRDFGKRRTVIVRAGQMYMAR